MKIVIDSKTNDLKVGKKSFNELDDLAKEKVEKTLRDFIIRNTKLNDYEEDCMWMSYRYCIGRHTIASHMHAGDIWKNCKNRISKERQLFNAFDINRSIEDCMRFSSGPQWYFPFSPVNNIYTTAIDIFCEFIEDFGVKSKEDYLKYYKINVILADNERGYKIETETWEEHLRPKVLKICKEFYENDSISEDRAWEIFNHTINNGNTSNYENSLKGKFKEISKNMVDPNYFYFFDIEDLFVWNDLVHCLDHEHHHKSVLTDGTECEWFWSWTNKSEQREDGYFYKTFGYKRIRVPIDSWNGSTTTYIPNESIKEDLY